MTAGTSRQLTHPRPVSAIAVSRAGQSHLPPAASQPLDSPDVLATITFYIGLGLVFVKFAMLQEIQSVVMHFNAHLMYLFGIPALAGVVLAGGLLRAMCVRAAFLWVGFVGWMIVATPFSVWRGDSFRTVFAFVRGEFVLFFVIAGLAVTWRQCSLVLKAIALAAVAELAAVKLLSTPGQDRVSLNWGGTTANSNDLAALLLLTIPLLLLAAYQTRWIVFRIAGYLLVAAGFITVLKTGSRGALLALGADILFLLFRGSARQRIALVCVVPLAAAAAMVLVPGTILNRLRSFSGTPQNAQSVEALESSESREYLFKKGIEYSLEFPLLGVGPGQFPNYEGGHNLVVNGRRGMWHDTHCTWLQASSECGIPALVFLLGAYISSFLLLNRTYRAAKTRPECSDIAQTCFYLMLAFIGFFIAISFLNFAYHFLGPALGGLSISVWRAAKVEFERRQPVPVAI